MVVFPEGTRSKTGQLNTFKSGSLRLAIRAGVPIVPLAIEGTNDMLEANDGKIKAAKVSLTINKPILPKEYEIKKSVEIAAELQAIIQSQMVENRELLSTSSDTTPNSVEYP